MAGGQEERFGDSWLELFASIEWLSRTIEGVRQGCTRLAEGIAGIGGAEEAEVAGDSSKEDSIEAEVLD